MKNINKIFKHIDDVIALGNKLALNDPYNIKEKEKGWSTTHCFRISDYNDGLGYEPCEEEIMIHKTIKPNHNNNIYYFLFHTYTPYGADITEEEVREKSEERKHFYKTNEVEVGITIEKRLNRPTDTCWGWNYHGYDYYIIKDGKTTISNNMAEIRRIYNNKPEWTQPNIRIEEYHSQKRKVFEIQDIQEIYSYKPFNRTKYVYLLETTDNEYYYIVDELEDLHHYACWLIDQDENLKISIVGGVEEAAKRFVNGETFNAWNWFSWSKLHEILDVEKDAESEYNKKTIQGISYPYEFLNKYQIIKQL